MAKKKKSVTAAEKALAKARIAVSDAGRAVKKLDKKTRRKADALKRELVEAEKSAKKSVARAERTESTRRTSQAEPITVQRIADPGPGTITGDGAGAPPTATYRELREQAKAKGIRGYSRMDKAALTTAIGDS